MVQHRAGPLRLIHDGHHRHLLNRSPTKPVLVEPPGGAQRLLLDSACLRVRRFSRARVKGTAGREESVTSGRQDDRTRRSFLDQSCEDVRDHRSCSRRSDHRGGFGARCATTPGTRDGGEFRCRSFHVEGGPPPARDEGGHQYQAGSRGRAGSSTAGA